MPNRARPRCPICKTAMSPTYRPRARGETLARIDELFWCEDCKVAGRGRTDTTFLLRKF